MPKEVMAFTLDKEVTDELRKHYRANMSYKVNQVLRKALLRPKKRRRSD